VFTVAVMSPAGVRAWSSAVATVMPAMPDAGMVTVRGPVWPVAALPPATVTATVRGSAGAGTAVITNPASPPSAMGLLLWPMRISGSAASSELPCCCCWAAASCFAAARILFHRFRGSPVSTAAVWASSSATVNPPGSPRIVFWAFCQLASAPWLPVTSRWRAIIVSMSASASEVSTAGACCCCCWAGGSSSSWTAAFSAAGVPSVYPEPAWIVSVTDPLGSSALSLTVASRTVAVPVVPMVTVRCPASPGASQSPSCVTVTVTASGAVGAGLAATMNCTSAPSVPPADATTDTCGTAAMVSWPPLPAGSLSATGWEAPPGRPMRNPPGPYWGAKRRVTDPSGSSVASSTVGTVNTARPDGPITTWCQPRRPGATQLPS